MAPSGVRSLQWLFLFTLSSAAGAASPESPMPSASPSMHQIDVLLFGQKCALVGPVAEDKLRGIHRVSPEQVYPEGAPPFSVNLGKNLKASLEALKEISWAASESTSLARYREKLTRRLEGQLAFVERSTRLAKDRFYKNYLTGASAGEFETLVKAKRPVSLLFEFYNEHIEPEPEEEFHQALRQLKIQYQCDFDGKSEG